MAEKAEPENDNSKMKKTINVTTADVTKDDQIVTDNVDLAQAFKNKKKNLANKIESRAKGSEDPKVSIEKKEPLESRLIREKMESKKVEKVRGTVTVTRETKEIIIESESNTRISARPVSREPTKEFLDRLVHGKKVNV